MSDLHADHVTPVLALEDPDACSPLVLRSCGYQAAKIIRKLTNDLGYAEQAKEALAAEITRLRAANAALERERDGLYGALQDTLANGSFYKETDVDRLMDERDAAKRERDALRDALAALILDIDGKGLKANLDAMYDARAAMEGAFP